MRRCATAFFAFLFASLTSFSISAPPEAEAFDFGSFGDLIEDALAQVEDLETNIQGFVDVIVDFYTDPSLSGGMDLAGFIQGTLTSFNSFDLSNPNLGSYGDCLQDPVDCVCQYLPFVCRVAPATAAMQAGTDPLAKLLVTMAAIKSFPEIGEEHPVILQFFRFANAIVTAEHAADDLKKYKNKAIKLKAKVKKLKFEVNAGTAPFTTLQKAKAKLSKTNQAVAEVQEAIELLAQNDPVGKELKRLKGELMALREA